MLSVLVDRDGWRREGRIGECADRHHDHVVLPFRDKVDRGAAPGAEVKFALRSTIANSNVLRSGAAGRETGAGESRLCAEHAARSLLTSETVANRNAQRLALHFYLNFAARTRCRTCGHDVEPDRWEANGLGLGLERGALQRLARRVPDQLG